MRGFPNRGIVEYLQAHYTKGSRVQLDSMEDPHSPPIGTLGTVIAVDDIGTIHVAWDTGSSLGIAYGEDHCHIVK